MSENINIIQQPEAEPNINKVLLIGVTGGTGGNAVKGFLEQGITNLRVITRKIDPNRPILSKLIAAGAEIVEADLDDEKSLPPALTDISAVYCHGTAADSAKVDPKEIERAYRLAQASKNSGVKHFVYNSAGGVDRNSGVSHIEQKYKVEQILKETGLPTTMLRACLFMEEFWKKYTRPSILKGSFPFSIPKDKALHLITTKDMGRIAAYVIKHREKYIGQEIELAGDILTPIQIAEAFSQIQGNTVTHKQPPAWIFLLLMQKELYTIIRWYSTKGYQANVEKLREEFPGLLTRFSEFLLETDWAIAQLKYEDL
jgi:uncharacterized protein YbjT (DUF2867 family)